jgi:uncharacterized protein
MHASPRAQACAIARKAMKIVAPQFRLNLQDGVHGVSHWSRVWVHGQALANTLDVNPCIPAWFAFLHDSQRRNDGTDPQHGARAADFALNLRKSGVLTELDAREFEHLCEAMRLHSDGHTLAEAAIQACWDADRLDLARVGIDPLPRYLCTAYARQTNTRVEAMRMSKGVRRSENFCGRVSFV